MVAATQGSPVRNNSEMRPGYGPAMKPRIGITTTPRVDEDRMLEALDRANVTAVVQAGGLPFVLPVLDPAEAAGAVACLDGLLLSGGGDVDPAAYGCEALPEVQGVDPGRDAWELALVGAASAADIPVLGICRGAQVVNVAAGGTLIQHLPFVTDLVHCRKDQAAAPVHTVSVLAGSRLAAATGSDLLGVNSLHHQAVGTVGAGLRPTGWAEDGTVEAVEGVDGRRVLGVQWHPELLVGAAAHAALFAWLVTEAGRPVVVPVIDTVQVMDTVPVMEALAVMDTVPVLDVLAVAEAVPAATVVGVEPVVTAPVAPVPALASAAA
jgi:putative glutamine amidotransferase